MKKVLKQILRRWGLLETARWLKQSLIRARFFRSNLRLWRDLRRRNEPIPPLRLIELVAGSPDAAWFLEGGRRGYASIVDALKRNNVDPEELISVLDFGCGCGRVTRYWNLPDLKLFGSDLNPLLIEWCRMNLPLGRFDVNDPAPPLRYGPAQFDLIYAFSVLTHMSEDMQLQWMQEFARILKPDGHLIVTTHGSYHRDVLRPEEQIRFDQGDLVLHVEGDPGSNQFGAYQSEKNVREQLAKEFVVMDFVPKGAAGNPFQDLWLLRKEE